MSAQIHVIMKPDMTLKEADFFLKKIHDAVIEKFGTEETTVIPKLS